MNNKPRLFPVFVAISLFLGSSPLPVAAQVLQHGALGAAAFRMPTGPARVSAVSPSGAMNMPVMPTAGMSVMQMAPAAQAPVLNAVVSAQSGVSINARPDALNTIAAEAAVYSKKAPAKTATLAAEKVGEVLDVAQAPSSKAPKISFDGAREKSAPIAGRMSLREQNPIKLPNGTRTDEQATIPSPDREAITLVESYGLPGGRDVGGIFETSRKVLSADPSNVDAVVTEVKAMIDADRPRYGVSSAELRLIGASPFKGRGTQADSIFIVFRQVKNGLEINGSALSFTIKVIKDKATIVAQTGMVFPHIDVNTETVLTDDQVRERIAERTGLSTHEVADKFKFYQEKIIYARGSWHHVKLYVADGLPFMVAVDMLTGNVFAWDNRAGLISDETEAAKNKSKVSGTIKGKTVEKGPIMDKAELSEVPLAFLEIKIGDKTYVTDKYGKFAADAGIDAAAGTELTATLSGPYIRVQDDSGKTLSINVKVKPGTNQIVFNPEANLSNENALAQVNAFATVNRALNYLRERKLTTAQMDKTQMPIRTNISQECNAYYTPGSPSENFFRSSVNCVNSAYDSVSQHETGHYWDDFTPGGIVNGGLSEGWGDILSMFDLNNPIIGEHFLKKSRGGVDYIRHGDNKYQYNEFDEVHAQGQAWGGFAWKLRKALIKKLGEAEGAAVVESLVLPTMFAKATTIPDAIKQVLVNATDKDGEILHEKEIRDAAKAHGIELPKSGAVAGMKRYRLAHPKLPVASVEPQLAAGTEPNVKAKISFEIGMLVRKRAINALRQFLDNEGVKYDLKEYDGWLSSDYLLIIEGPEKEVRRIVDAIEKWLEEHSK